MTRITGFIVAGLAAASVAASAARRADCTAAYPRHDRGRERQHHDGQVRHRPTIQVALDNKAKYVSVVPSSLASLKKGEFIGTATKGPEGFHGGAGAGDLPGVDAWHG